MILSTIVVVKNMISKGFQLIVGVRESINLLLLANPHIVKPSPSSTPEKKLPPIFLKTYFLSSKLLLSKQKLTVSRTTARAMHILALAVCIKGI